MKIETTTLAWQDRKGDVPEIEIERPRPMIYPRLSPDDSRAAVDIRDRESDTQGMVLGDAVFQRDVAGLTVLCQAQAGAPSGIALF